MSEESRFKLNIDEEVKNITINAFITPTILIPLNIIILFVYPFIEPYIFGWLMQILAPYVPTTFDFLGIFIYIFIAFFTIIGLAYSIMLLMNVISFLGGWGMKKRLNIEVKRTYFQISVQKITPIMAIAIVTWLYFLFFQYGIFIIPSSILNFFTTTDITQTVILASLELHYYVVVFIALGTVFNGILTFIIDLAYWYYRRSENILLNEEPIYEYVEE